MSGTIVRPIPAARTAAEILADIMGARTLTGWAWNADPTSNLGQWFAPLADFTATFEDEALALLQEVDPRTSVQLISDYEQVLGPDPAGRDRVAQTLAQQQAMVFQRWTARGGQSIAYYQSIGASLGVSVTITEFTASVCGPQTQCGAATLCGGSPFYWQVSLPASNPASPGVWAMIELYAPAHTVPFVVYA